MMINGDTLRVKHIHVRGNTSSYYRRKCFNIKTTRNTTFHTNDEKFSLDKFYAISMNMDRNYIRNKIAFEVLKLTDVHTPLNCYAELRINDASEGLYLIFYPPDEYAMKKFNSPFVIRRGYDESIDKVFADKDLDRAGERALRKKYQSLYSSTLNKNGQELSEDISNVLDLNSYFTWLAFNHLFQNGDYADEVYLMWNKNKLKFEVVPWDFDDLLKGAPHEGIAERQQTLADKLVFSLEDKLDQKIASDPLLYSKYLEQYAVLLNTLTSEKLKDILSDVYDEVYPYYLQADILEQSKYDQYGQTDLDMLEADLNSIYNYISLRSKDLLERINSTAH